VIDYSSRRLTQSNYGSKKLRQPRFEGLTSSLRIGCSKRDASPGLRLEKLARRRKLIKLLSELRSSRLVELSNDFGIVQNLLKSAVKGLQSFLGRLLRRKSMVLRL
jgi:hypothetical protein